MKINYEQRRINWLFIPYTCLGPFDNGKEYSQNWAGRLRHHLTEKIFTEKGKIVNRELEKEKTDEKLAKINSKVKQLTQKWFFPNGDPGFIIKLVIGGKKSTFIQSNLSEEDLDNAYKKGSELMGFNLLEEYCQDDALIPESIITSFQEQKWEPQGLSKSGDEMFFVTRVKNWLDLYLIIVKMGNPKFEYRDWSCSSLDIKGYGLLRKK